MTTCRLLSLREVMPPKRQRSAASNDEWTLQRCLSELPLPPPSLSCSVFVVGSAAVVGSARRKQLLINFSKL